MIKNKLSLLAGKICSVCGRIWPIKIQRLLWFITRPCLKFAERFSASATLHSQKIVKEIAYIPTSFQAPFKSANFFCLFACSKDIEDKRQLKLWILYWLLVLFPYLQLIEVNSRLSINTQLRRQFNFSKSEYCNSKHPWKTV